MGKLVSCKDAGGNELLDGSGRFLDPNHIANVNPHRYRAYYFDVETGWYYLNSRYYDPATGRFINADGQLNGGILGMNMYAYCENNPVKYL